MKAEEKIDTENSIKIVQYLSPKKRNSNDLQLELLQYSAHH